MKKAAKHLLIIIFFISQFQTEAQDHDNNVFYSLENIQNGVGAGEIFKTPSQAKFIVAEGSPYFSDTFTDMIIFLKGKRIPINQGRFNVFEDKIDVRISGGQYEIYLDEIEKFKLVQGRDTLSFVRNKKISDQSDAFFQLMNFDGGINLYIQTEIVFKKPTYNYKLAKGDKNGKFIRNEDHYLESGDVLMKMKNKSTLYKFFKKDVVNNAWQELDYCDLKDTNCLIRIIRKI